MKSLFSPAVALMDRMGYTRKFALLWLMALIALMVLAASLFVSLNKEISFSQRELQGIALIAPISRAVQSIQQHRGFSAMYLSGNEAARGGHDAAEKAAIRDFDALERMLPRELKETESWGSVKAGWEGLQKEEFSMGAADNLAAHTRLIYDLLFFEVAVADEYALTLDPQIDTYYLIDTAVNKLPAVLEHIGQLRAHGAGMLTSRQVTEAQKVGVYKVMGMLSDVTEASEVNLGKTVRYNPAMRERLSSVSGTIADAAHRVTDTLESDIFAGNFTQSPESFFALSTLALDEGYRQIYGTLLPAIEVLLKARIAQLENTLYVSIGVALSLLGVVGYLSAGIYLSIVGNVRSLADSARAFAAGDMRARVRLRTRDELGQVGGSFNEMAESFNVMLAARQQAVDDMLKSEAKFRSLFEASSDALMLLDETGFLDCNESALRLFGCPSRDEFAGKRPSELSPSAQTGGRDSESLASEHIARAFSEGSDQFEWVHRRFNGEEFSAEVLLTAMEVDGRRILQATVRDITGRKQAEEKLRAYNEELKAINRQLQDTQNQLLQSEKMASIGQLAAGVAHEINNPIGYVYSNLGTLEKYVQDAFGMIEQYERAEGAIADEAVRARLKAAREKLDIEFLKEDLSALMSESKDGITRVKTIVQNLKDFSHVDASDEWHYSDLHKGLDSTLNIVHNEIKYKADVVREYGDLPEVECLPSQLNQVFMNLLVNAAHAIEERGTITIRTGREGEEVWVEIADTGKGIPPENMKKIFDPFFTTKPIGKGTGLGLSLSYGIVQKHGGRIEVRSEVGKGTAFRVWLPVRHADSPLPGQDGECHALC